MRLSKKCFSPQIICKDTIKIAKMLFLIIITLNKALLFLFSWIFYIFFKKLLRKPLQVTLYF